MNKKLFINTHLSLLVQTLCALGLRVSEIKAVTVESLESGEATIQNGEFSILLRVFTFSEKLSNPWENAKLYRVKIHGNVPECQAPSPLLLGRSWIIIKI